MMLFLWGVNKGHYKKNYMKTKYSEAYSFEDNKLYETCITISEARKSLKERAIDYVVTIPREFIYDTSP